MNRRHLVTSLAAVTLLAACAGPTEPTREGAASATSALRLPTLPVLRDSLLAADAAVANDATLRGVDGLLAHLSDDASLLVRRSPLITGKSAIAAYFAASPLGGTIGWRYARGDVSALGDLGYTLGWGEVIGAPDATGNAAAQWFVYAATWERRASGEWRITSLLKLDLVGPPSAPPSGLLPNHADGPVYPSFLGADATATKVAAADTAFAALTQQVGPQKGFDAYDDDDAIELSDPFVLGKSAIFAEYAAFPATSTLDWSPTIARGARSGDLGFTIGTYTSTSLSPDGTRTARYGKYLTVWRRKADGSFKWVLDGGNSSPAPS